MMSSETQLSGATWRPLEFYIMRWTICPQSALGACSMGEMGDGGLGFDARLMSHSLAAPTPTPPPPPLTTHTLPPHTPPLLTPETLLTTLAPASFLCCPSSLRRMRCFQLRARSTYRQSCGVPSSALTASSLLVLTTFGISALRMSAQLHLVASAALVQNPFSPWSFMVTCLTAASSTR